MLQPFEIFKPSYLEGIISLKKVYLVTQTYTRGFDHFTEVKKIDILVTDYDDLQYAKIHLQALKNDKYASIIHLENEAHKAKFIEMITGEKYRVYWAIVASREQLQKRLDIKYKDHVRRYIQKHTTWRIDANAKIVPKFEVTYGELYIVIKYSSQTLRIKFEDIEKS